MKGHRLNVMVQLPYPEDKAKLPLGLYIQRVYTELKDGSRNVSTVLRNGTGKPMHLAAGRLVGRIVAVNVVLDAMPSPELEVKLRGARSQTSTLGLYLLYFNFSLRTKNKLGCPSFLDFVFAFGFNRYSG